MTQENVKSRLVHISELSALVDEVNAREDGPHWERSYFPFRHLVVEGVIGNIGYMRKDIDELCHLGCSVYDGSYISQTNFHKFEELFNKQDLKPALKTPDRIERELDNMKLFPSFTTPSVVRKVEMLQKALEHRKTHPKEEWVHYTKMED